MEEMDPACLLATFLDSCGIETQNERMIDPQAINDVLFPALQHKLCEII